MYLYLYTAGRVIPVISYCRYDKRVENGTILTSLASKAAYDHACEKNKFRLTGTGHV